MSEKRNLILLAVIVILVAAWSVAGWFQGVQSAKEAKRQADIAAAIERAEAAEREAEAADARARVLRSMLDRQRPIIVESRRRIREHRHAPIDKNPDTDRLVTDFVLLGYGLPRE